MKNSTLIFIVVCLSINQTFSLKIKDRNKGGS